MATVLVVSVLVMLLVLGVVMVWNGEYLLYARASHLRTQRANIESAFTLYENHSELFAHDSVITLFDSIPSEVEASVTAWGLYDVVSMTAIPSGVHQTRIVGLRNSSHEQYVLYYPDRKSALSLSGNTNIVGKAVVPAKGVSYTQMGSVFFSGQKLLSNNISQSNEELPSVNHRTRVDSLFGATKLTVLSTDSLHNNFYRTATAKFAGPSDALAFCQLSGNITLYTDELYVDASAKLSDIIVCARTIIIGEKFEGSAQFFASDSIIVLEGAKLNYPSGIYARNYAELSDGCTVDGYVIVDGNGAERKNKDCNYRQHRTAKVRGLLYVDGVAQLQGVVSGVACLAQATYFAPQGYYRNMIYDASILSSDLTAMPVWCNTDGKRKTIKWVE